ncbi:MAG: DNA repair protein RecO [Pseudomonadota bacterium]
MSDRRVELEPAYILHHRPFRDSSQIIDVFSREHGKLSLVARGSRAGKSKLKGILRPFQRLRLSWALRTELGTLTGGELAGEPLPLAGDVLFSAYYLNELLLHFLHRFDPQPEIFTLYEDVLRRLSASRDPAAALRHFELALLRLLGYALDLEHDAASGEPLEDAVSYEYRVEQGAVRGHAGSGGILLNGSLLKSIAAEAFDDPETLKAAGRLLRRVIGYHLGGKELKSRKVLIELYRDRMRRPAAASGQAAATRPEDGTARDDS